MLKRIIQAIIVISSISLINSQPVTTDMMGSTDMSTMDGSTMGARYVIGYFEISSTLSVPNAYPINQCTLYSLISSKYKYIKYMCDSGSNMVFKEYYSASDCAESSVNVTIRETIMMESALQQGDINTFNCDGSDDSYITIESCSSSVDGNLLMVPNICYFDSGSSSAYEVGCVDSSDDGQYDSIYLYTYNLDDDAPTSCSDDYESHTKISFSESSCTTLFNGFTGYGVEASSQCPVAPDDDGDDDSSSNFINSFISFIVIIISFVIIM